MCSSPMPGDDRLLGLLVVGQEEGVVLLGDALQHLVHLVLVLLCPGRDGQGVDGCGKLERRIDDRGVRRVKGIIRPKRRALREHPEVTCRQLGDVFQLLPHAGVDLRDLLFLAFAGDEEIRLCRDLPRHHLEVGKLAGELVHRGLENEA